VAGSGTAGYNGDSGPAGSAQLNNPSGVAVDGAGNLYIADTANQRVRMVSTTGLITTVAGTGSAGLTGDGGPAAAGTVDLYYPFGVAVDGAGNLYIVDRSNQGVRMVDLTATPPAITTVAGSGTIGYTGDCRPAGSAQLHAPSGVAVDSAGNLYIADRSNHRVRMVELAQGVSS
jgi:sugar lactone lactonase YvrE